jgi:predicted pyridoxine 5'-phosphate oxidase superfamily flavin-nucleotide-binding protein
MGRIMDHIDTATREWIDAQLMFFVATAPESGGHVNVSPKGFDSLRILNDREIAYLDLTGSGVETIAHIRENGRITVMWNAFEGEPRILRVYGEGHVHLPGTDRFEELVGLFDERRGTRSVITIDVERVQNACGFGVPKMALVEIRTGLDTWVRQRSDDEIAQYWDEKNAVSIDGLPTIG